jgi:hypothetical protein
LLDDLGEGAPAVRSGGYVALVQAGACAQLLLELVGECLGMRAVASVTGGNCGVLVAKAATNRRAYTASSSCHESHSVAQLVAGPTPRGILLFGIQVGHDGSPPAGKSALALAAALYRGGVPIAIVPPSKRIIIDLIEKIFF